MSAILRLLPLLFVLSCNKIIKVMEFVQLKTIDFLFHSKKLHFLLTN